MSGYIDFYEVLGIERGASIDEIRQAYLRLAKEHHPDKGGNAEKFRLIRMAYETLSDARKRTQYDATNEQNPTISFLTRLFLHTLDSSDPEKVNLFKVMESQIVMKIHELASQKQSIKRRIKKMEKTLRRIKTDAGGLFKSITTMQIEISKEAFQDIEKAEKVALDAHKKVLGCEYELDPVTLQITLQESGK